MDVNIAMGRFLLSCDTFDRNFIFSLVMVNFWKVLIWVADIVVDF